MKKYLVTALMLLVSGVALQAVPEQKGQGTCMLTEKDGLLGLWDGNVCKRPNPGDSCKDKGLIGTWSVEYGMGRCNVVNKTCNYFIKNQKGMLEYHAGLWDGEKCQTPKKIGVKCLNYAYQEGTWDPKNEECYPDQHHCIFQKGTNGWDSFYGAWDAKTSACIKAQAGAACTTLNGKPGTWFNDTFNGCKEAGDICYLKEFKKYGIWDGKQCNAKVGISCKRDGIDGTFYDDRCQVPNTECSLSDDKNGIWDGKIHKCIQHKTGDSCTTYNGKPGTWYDGGPNSCRQEFEFCMREDGERGVWRGNECAVAKVGDKCLDKSGKLGTYIGKEVVQATTLEDCLQVNDICQAKKGDPKGTWDGKECNPIK